MKTPYLVSGFVRRVESGLPYLSLFVVCLALACMAPARALGQDVDTATAAVEAAAAHAGDPAASHEAAGEATGMQDAGEHGQEAGHGGEHPEPPVWLVLPFVAILLMIATGPLFYPHHWHHHYPKYAIGLGLIVVFYYIFGMGTVVPVQHALDEYLSFIALVASLFIAASGIYVSINAKGTPRNNIILLFCASVIANLIATTGSAMLFIRSFMRLNKGRLKAYHIIFFIFLVANVGGALTPIGDPPLFLGFLRGVPFFWTFTHVWYIWLPTTIMILAVFYVFDKRNKLESPDPEPGKPLLGLQGTKSFFWVLLIILLVFVDPNVFSWVPSPKNLHLPFGFHLPLGIREAGMFLVAFLAYKTADKEAMAKNEFNFEPIREVGWLFLGIFATMQPALELISSFAQHHAEDLTVGMFYWGTGALSGILDNAPTYLNFVAAAMGKFGLDVNLPAHVKDFALPEMAHPDSWHFLQAISVAAVFFGAMSYIGNAPNFMVKAIAEANGVETPSFMGYILRYSIPILLPIYFIIYVIFYSGWVLPVN
ncbi:MAG: citrate transporter [Rhodothermaceae bacterium]|nr:MAG: citrate transporter [Rhodothermaceae bacterium]